MKNSTKELQPLYDFFNRLNNKLDEIAKSNGIKKKDIAKKLGYKSQSGLSNAIARGTLKFGELRQICTLCGIDFFDCINDDIKKFIDKQPIFRLMGYFKFLMEKDLLEEVYRKYRNGHI